MKPAGLSVKKLLWVLGLVATAYAAALLVFGDASPAASLQPLWSWVGLQAVALCLANYLLRGLRWRAWMALHQRPLGRLEGLRLYLAGYAFTPTPGNVGEAVRGLWLTQQPLSTAQSLAIFGAERLADLLGLLLMAVPALLWFWWHSPWGPAAWGWQADAALWLGLGAALLATLAAWALTRAGRWLGRTANTVRWAWLNAAWLCLAHQPWRWLSLTLLAWAAQGLAVALLCQSAGLPLAKPAASTWSWLARVLQSSWAWGKALPEGSSRLPLTRCSSTPVNPQSWALSAPAWVRVCTRRRVA